jgi:peptidyl-prolyl cis-trans isomerase SurA
MRSRLAAALVAAFAPAAASSAAPAQTVERIVAVVDDRPVLLSELRAHEAVSGLPEERALEAAIDERLMHAEAARIAQAEVTVEEEDKALALLLETQPALRAQVSEAELRRLLHRQLAILKYVEFRFRPQLRVSDEEVRQAWREEQAGRPAGPAFEDEQDAIRARLERRALDERVEAWVKDLRARADVRYVPAPPPPARAAAGGP